MADDNVQPVPWVFGWRCAARRDARRALADQQIDALGAVETVAALDQHVTRAERQDLPRPAPHVGLAARQRRVGQRRGFRAGSASPPKRAE